MTLCNFFDRRVVAFFKGAVDEHLFFEHLCVNIINCLRCWTLFGCVGLNWLIILVECIHYGLQLLLLFLDFMHRCFQLSHQRIKLVVVVHFIIICIQL